VIIGSTFAAYFLSNLLTTRTPTASGLLLMFLLVGLGLVGFLDDYIKIAKQRSLGLRSRAKMTGQCSSRSSSASWPCSSPTSAGQTPASHFISFTRDYRTSSCRVPGRAADPVHDRGHQQRREPHRRPRRARDRRLHDGVRRLHDREHLAEQPVVRADTRQHLLRGPRPARPRDRWRALTGACFGFLWWNASPAKIFMGDTGSLALGGALGGLAILTRTESCSSSSAAVRVAGAVGDAAGRLLQGDRGKRMFRMAPLHHHFELKGWDEITIVIRFWIITGHVRGRRLGIFYAEWVAGA
jgi:phospho-N-acetylmuramoyl-pentapeptide-transferase